VLDEILAAFSPSGHMDALSERWTSMLSAAGSAFPAAIMARLSNARVEDVVLLLWAALQVGSLRETLSVCLWAALLRDLSLNGRLMWPGSSDARIQCWDLNAWAGVHVRRHVYLFFGRPSMHLSVFLVCLWRASCVV
jgi:hypothetical protein